MARNLAIVIPALNPSKDLIQYVNALITKGFAQIIVVNDGSKEELSQIFHEIGSLDQCTVLTHEVNRGKGRALKTAFSYVLEHHQTLDGIITADADGQHSVHDVCKVADAMNNRNASIILGVRDFSQANVPKRSWFGNRLTSLLFWLLFGIKLDDTQTGLRGIPLSEIPKLLKLKGERFEYEMNMLIYVARMKINIIEVPIETIYYNKNAGSHYKFLRDSLRIFTNLSSGYMKMLTTDKKKKSENNHM